MNGLGKEDDKGKLEAFFSPLQILIGLSLLLHCLLKVLSIYFVYIVKAKYIFLSRKESICGL